MSRNTIMYETLIETEERYLDLPLYLCVVVYTPIEMIDRIQFSDLSGVNKSKYMLLFFWQSQSFKVRENCTESSLYVGVLEQLKEVYGIFMIG